VSLVQTFGLDGIKTAEIETDCSRTWKINDYGRCQFTLSIRDPKCTLEHLQFGNYILVEHEKLPAWGGVIDTPREWGRNVVQITGYSAEKIFEWRRVAAVTKITATPGKIFKEIIRKANIQGNTRISAGENIITKGKAVAWEFNLLNVYDEIIRLAEDTDDEWRIVPKAKNGAITFDAQWAPRLGEVRNYLLKETHNIEADNNVLVEQGQIANDVYGIGNGASDESKETARLTDDDSIAKYGLRQYAKTFQQDEYSSIKKGVRATINQMKEPKRTFSLSALDVGDTWLNIDVGDTLQLQMSNVGFLDDSFGLVTDVRIKGMTFLEDEGKLELVAEEKYE